MAYNGQAGVEATIGACLRVRWALSADVLLQLCDGDAHAEREEHPELAVRAERIN